MESLDVLKRVSGQIANALREHKSTLAPEHREKLSEAKAKLDGWIHIEELFAWAKSLDEVAN